MTLRLLMAFHKREEILFLKECVRNAEMSPYTPEIFRRSKFAPRIVRRVPPSRDPCDGKIEKITESPGFAAHGRKA